MILTVNWSQPLSSTLSGARIMGDQNIHEFVPKVTIPVNIVDILRLLWAIAFKLLSMNFQVADGGAARAEDVLLSLQQFSQRRIQTYVESVH